MKKPSYSESSIFLLSIGFLLTLFWYKDLQQVLWQMIIGLEPLFYGLGLIAIFGSLVSVFYTLNLKATPPLKFHQTLVVTGVIYEILSAIAVVLFLGFESYVALFFAVINSFHAIYLISLLNRKKLDYKDFNAANASLYEILFGMVSLLILFGITAIAFDNHWATTFAIMVSYAMIINDSIAKRFSSAKL